MREFALFGVVLYAAGYCLVNVVVWGVVGLSWVM